MSFKYLSEVNDPATGMYAKVVAASQHKWNNQDIWTLEIRSPKSIDAEFGKHRVFSRSSASSRAIPFDPPALAPFVPVDIRNRGPGMNSPERVPLEVAMSFQGCVSTLYQNARSNLYAYRELIHKQHLNRYLEPWMMQVSVITSTEWDNFFELRMPDSLDDMDFPADPMIQRIATLMADAMDFAEEKVSLLDVDEWHLPYVLDEEREIYGDAPWRLANISAARCARASFNKHGVNEMLSRSKRMDADRARAVDLRTQRHMVPFEHQATPMKVENQWPGDVLRLGHATHMDDEGVMWSGNFRYWTQNRQMIDRLWRKGVFSDDEPIEFERPA